MFARSSLEFFAFDSSDSDDVRAEKAAILLVAGACCVAGAAWTAMYVVMFGPSLTAALPFLFVVIVGIALVVAHRTRDHRIAVYAQIFCIVYVTAGIQWSIGGVFDSGFVLAWAFLGPLIALMFLSTWQAVFWLGLFVVNVLATAVFNDFFDAHGRVVSESQRVFFFALNFTIASLVVFLFAAYFVRNALSEKRKADELLRNILPEQIARTLKTTRGVIAEEFDNVSVLFADIVDYTAYSSTKTPSEVVDKLNEIFERFDALASKHGLEKIKTIGDAYMVVGGLPEPHEGHERAIADFALDMMKAAREVEKGDGNAFAVRIGIHCGPVVAGVIGSRKFAYDLWGDTVNVASRLESHGVPGRAQVSGDFAARIRGWFRLEARGEVNLKGKGAVETFFLLGPTPTRKISVEGVGVTAR